MESVASSEVGNLFGEIGSLAQETESGSQREYWPRSAIFKRGLSVQTHATAIQGHSSLVRVSAPRYIPQMPQDVTGRLNLRQCFLTLGLFLCVTMILLSRRESVAHIPWMDNLLPRPATAEASLISNSTAGNTKRSLSAQLNRAAGHQDTSSMASTTTSEQSSSALQNFQARCKHAGVIVCQGFDEASAFLQPVWPNTGFYYKKECPTWPTPCVQQDRDVSFSGTGSARWDIYGNTGENFEANWLQNFGQTFGRNSTFYVQYAFRADPNWVSIDWTKTGPRGGNTAPKLSIFHNHDSTCAAEEITIHDHNSWTMPTGYSDCGNKQFITKLDGVTYTSKGDFLLQQGFTAPAPFTGEKCQWKDDRPTGTCFKIQPNTWYTLYFKVHVGDWGQPNSSVEAWFAPQGQSMRKFINVMGYTLNQDKGSAGFDTLTLTQYMTGKQSSVAHPTAHVWYDELIVSTRSIQAPTGPTP
jgi:hypothetical protein